MQSNIQTKIVQYEMCSPWTNFYSAGIQKQPALFIVTSVFCHSVPRWDQHVERSSPTTFLCA